MSSTCAGSYPSRPSARTAGPRSSGPAPTGFVINVTGAFNGAVPLSARAISATVGPGTYNLAVLATNACGASDPTTVQTVTVP